MIPQIASAMSKGFTASQVIKFILRKFPNQKDAIEKALSAGFTADQVIRYLSRKSGKELEEPTKPQIETDYSQMRDIDKARREKEEKVGAMALAAPIAGQAGLSALSAMNAPGQAMAMQHAMPQSPIALQGNIPQKLLTTATQQPPNAPINPMGGAPQGIPPASPNVPVNPQNILQPNIPTQAINPQLDIKKSVDIIKSTGHEATVKNLIEGGLSPRDIKDTLGQIMGKKNLKELEKISGGVEQAIEDYASSMTQQQPEQPQEMVEQLTNQKMPIEQGQVSTNAPIEEIENVRKEKPEIKFESVSDDPEKWKSLSSEWKKEQIAESWDDEKKNKNEKISKYKSFDIYHQKINDEEIDGKITVVDKHNNVIAKTFYGTADDGKNIEASVEVDPDFRRQGIASKMYEEIEKISGKKLVPAETHTPLAKALWEGRDRKFGLNGHEENKNKPIQKNETVSTPQGIGEVKEIRNGKALVEVDGKLHKFEEKDLEKPLFTDDEIADNYERLMSSIPEEHRSGFISWAGYDEDTGILGYIPRGGKYETLDNITPKEAELIKTGKGVARTSGKNTEGIWVLGGDTRGLISQIQHDRRRAREAEDKKQLRLFEVPKREKEDKGMKPIYDEMAYARGLSEARKKKAADEARAKKKADKEAEKERLKREKNEAKKRKK